MQNVKIVYHFSHLTVGNLRYNEHRRRVWTVYCGNTPFKKFWRFNGVWTPPSVRQWSFQIKLSAASCPGEYTEHQNRTQHITSMQHHSATDLCPFFSNAFGLYLRIDLQHTRRHEAPVGNNRRFTFNAIKQCWNFFQLYRNFPPYFCAYFPPSRWTDVGYSLFSAREHNPEQSKAIKSADRRTETSQASIIYS